MAELAGGPSVAYTTGRWRCMVTGCRLAGLWQAAARPSFEAHRHYLSRHYTPPPTQRSRPAR